MSATFSKYSKNIDTYTCPNCSFNYLKDKLAIFSADNKKALCELANSLEKGTGVSVDLNKATSLYKQAADQGDEEGQYNLALAYHLGKGVEEDLDKAIRILNNLHHNGHKQARKLLSNFYEIGYVIKNINTNQYELSEKIKKIKDLSNNKK